jgi:hypothetical protein
MSGHESALKSELHLVQGRKSGKSPARSSVSISGILHPVTQDGRICHFFQKDLDDEWLCVCGERRDAQGGGL